MEIRLVKKVMEKNTNIAGDVRRHLRTNQLSMFNFMSSPGSGKTRLLEALIPIMKRRGLRVGVIEGDITTTRDAERLQPLDIPIAQINTEFFGGDCHLAANVVLEALRFLHDYQLDIILLENVGNLVCPAEFDTGSDMNLVLLSVTEGEDKPLKYPLMFRNCHAALIGKIDLVAAAEIDLALLKRNLLQINGELAVLEVSGKSGQGMESLANLMIEKHKRTQTENSNGCSR